MDMNRMNNTSTYSSFTCCLEICHEALNGEESSLKKTIPANENVNKKIDVKSMKLSAIHFFLILLLVGMPLLYGQEAENTPPLPPSVGSAINRSGGNNQSFGERMGVIRSGADSVMKETTGKIGAVADGFDQLPTHLEAKLLAKADSLQKWLDSLKAKAAWQIEKAEEKAGVLTRRIDSLQSLLGKTIRHPELARLPARWSDSSGGQVSGSMTPNRLPGMGIPDGISKIELPSMKGLNLTERIDQLIRNEILSQAQDDRRGIEGKVKGFDGLGERQLEMLNQVQHDVKGGDPSQIDQLANAQASQISELKELGAQTKELGALKGLPEEMLADLKRYQNEQALKEELKNKAVQKATDYLAGHMDKITKAQGAMSALKKKYSYVPDSRDLSTAVKNTSLKNEPLKRRFRYGLGFQIHRADPVSLDLSPNVQYRFNKLFSVGVSGTYRANLPIENNTAKAAQALPDIYGVSAFAQYRLSFIKPGNKWLGGFFAHAEFEYMSTRPQGLKTKTQTPVEEPARTWHPGLPVGIGKQMRLSKALSGVIIFTYDLLHNEYSPNPKAWNIKFGFQLGRFRLRDIHI